MAIQMPITWGLDQIRGAAVTIGGANPGEYWAERRATGRPVVRRIGLADLRAALADGWRDFGSNRTDVIFLSVLYPVVGIVIAWFAAGQGGWPLLFPLAAGFVLVGPLAAVGLVEMSRRREETGEANWLDAFGVMRSPAIGRIALLGLLLVEVFFVWLFAAQAIYGLTLGPGAPASAAAFMRDVFTTGPGWAMIVIGVGVGFLFAVLVLAIGAISFPMLLDRDVGLGVAVGTSIRALLVNPKPMAAWGIVVAAALVLGSLPLLFGLAVVVPVLGHATWHLYRRLVD